MKKREDSLDLKKILDDKFFFRFSSDLRITANQSIKFRAANRYGKKVESFSEYLRNLILEEWERNKRLYLDDTDLF